MRKITLFMHVSLDGFVAGPAGEMDWITVDEEIFDFAGKMTDISDTALYGRKTFEMMHSYWPTAAQQDGASRHDKQHSRWYNKVSKVVLSKTLNESEFHHVKVIGDNIEENIRELKNKSGKDILMFGSPTAFHTLFNAGLVDELWLFINPVVIVKGIPLFSAGSSKVNLSLLETKNYACGVLGLNYGVN